MQILIHTVRMACILHIGQKVEIFQAFESANERYQNAESVQFYKTDRSVAKAQVHISYKLSKRLKYCEVTFRCIHGGKNFKSRGTGVRESIYLRKTCLYQSSADKDTA